jgi:type I restriction enzyme S subunit
MKTWSINRSQVSLTPLGLANSPAKIVPEGSVLIVVRSGVLKHSLPIGIARRPVTLNQDMKAIVCSESILPEYLARFIQWRSRQILTWVRATTADNFPIEKLKDLRIPIPPIDEQRRIAGILNQTDEVRAKRRQAVTLLEDLTRSIFIYMFGDPGSTDLRWPCLTVSDVAHQVTDGEHLTPIRERGGIKLLSARNIQDGFIDFSKVDYIGSAEYARISRRCNPQPGDVLLSCSGTIGRVALVETDEPLSLVRSVALIKPNHEMVASDYLLNVLRMPSIKNAMLKAANASSQANLFQGPIRALSVPVPPIKLQEEFSRRFRSVAALKATQTEDSRALSEFFASLQAKAFRNEL